MLEAAGPHPRALGWALARAGTTSSIRSTETQLCMKSGGVSL